MNKSIYQLINEAAAKKSTDEFKAKHIGNSVAGDYDPDDQGTPGYLYTYKVTHPGGVHYATYDPEGPGNGVIIHKENPFKPSYTPVDDGAKEADRDPPDPEDQKEHIDKIKAAFRQKGMIK